MRSDSSASRLSVRGETARLALLVASFAIAYALYGIVRHWHFETSAYDLGIFDQAIWHLSRFEAPASTISGFNNILGDHFYPIIALLAPLYWVSPHPETLIVAQAVLFAVSLVPVFIFLADRLPRGSAYALTIACGLFWGMQRAAAFDFHEVAFAPLAIATAILAMDKRRWPLFWISVAAIITTKEDLIPLVVMFGVFLFLKGDRLRGAVIAVSSTVMFLIVILFVVPHFNESHGYAYTGIYADIAAHPWRLLPVLVTPKVKVSTALMWFAPFLFLPLGSPFAMFVLPIAAERLLSSNPNHWGMSFHYSAPLAPILAMSAGDGLARLARAMQDGRRARRTIAWASAATLLLASLLPGHLPLWRLLDPRHYGRTPAQLTGEEIAHTIPPQASVVAQAAIVPHLSERNQIVMLDSRGLDGDYVISADDFSPWPNQTIDDVRALIEQARRRGYVVVMETNGWTLLRRRTPSP